MQTRTLLIVYHSRTGGSRQMAAALEAGAAAETGVMVRLLEAGAAKADDVLGADAYAFVAPENLATLSGEMKEFFDRCYYAVLDRINGRAYATLICAGSDGSGAARQVARIATGWRLRAMAEPLIVCTRAQTEEEILAPKRIDEPSLARCRELGVQLATGLALGIY